MHLIGIGFIFHNSFHILIDGGAQMLKIIWNKEDALRIQEQLKDEFSIVLVDDPSVIPQDKVGIVIDEADYDKLKPVLELISYQKTTLMFETSNGWVRLPVQSMTYLESYGEEIYIHTTDLGQITIRQPLYQLEELLKPYHFVRISKSYIVNIAKIRYIKTTFNAKLDLQLLNGNHLEVSRSYVKAFKETLGLRRNEK